MQKGVSHHLPQPLAYNSKSSNEIYSMFSLILALLLLLQLFLNLTAANVNVDYLWVVHDAGESYYSEPVIQDILMNDPSKTLKILCLGEPSTSLFTSLGEHQITLSELGIEVDIRDGTTYARKQQLTPKDLEIITSAITTKKVITGTVYKMQAQIAAAFLQEDSTKAVIGIYDSFSLYDVNSITNEDFVVVSGKQVIDTLYISAADQQSSVITENNITPLVVGNPSLESWDSIQSDTASVMNARQLIFDKQNQNGDGSVTFSSDTSVLFTFAGDYGESDYDDSVILFCDTVSSMSNDALFAFTPHPGYPSSYEEAIFQQHGCSDHIVIVTPDMELSTALVVAASNASMSYCSTVGGQSISIGVPHVYTVPSSANACNDMFTAADVIGIDESVSSLQNTLLVDFKEVEYVVDPVSISTAGIPLNSTDIIVENLLS